MALLPPLDVKDPAWRETVLAVLSAKTTRGVPIPDGLEPGGRLKLGRAYGRWRVSYCFDGAYIITLGTASIAHQEELYQEHLRRGRRIWLDDGTPTIVVYDDNNPDLPRPVPERVYRQQMQGQRSFA